MCKIIQFALLIIFLCINNNFCQIPVYDSLVVSRLAELNSRGIDTILVYQDGCIGCEVVIESDESSYYSQNKDGYSETYIFYKSNNLVFLDKIINYKLYKTLQIDNNNFFDFYFINEKIFNEEVDYYKKRELSSKNGKKVYLPPLSTHYDYKSISFYCSELKLTFKVKEYEFEDKGSPKYLDYKWKRKQKEWVDSISRLLKTL